MFIFTVLVGKLKRMNVNETGQTNTWKCQEAML